jgi:Ca-activated chloride channel family protein
MSAGAGHAMGALQGLLARLPVPVEGFEAPGWLLALPLVAVALAALALRARPVALAWPALDEGRAAGARARDPQTLLAFALRLAAVAALLLALAGPVGPAREVELRHDGLDLLLVMDASGSMRALDARGPEGWRTRLGLAREVVARFASHRMASGDRVGLVVFGASAFTQSPLTEDGALLGAALDRVEAGIAGEATALGDALALAVKRALAADEEAGHPAREPGAGRVIVLLTDGRANAGAVPVDVAAGLAARHGIRVHTVGIGTSGEVAMATPSGGRSLRTERHDLDLATLERIAAATGGRAFHARRSVDLARVYAEIDRIERVPRPAPPRVAGEPVHGPFLATAGLLVALEVLATRVLARRLP